MARNSIAIDILANAKQAQGEVNGFVGGLKSSFGKVAGIVAAAGIGAAVVGVAKSAVDAASAAQQSLGATQTVFGKSADQIIKKSDQAAKAVGLSANQYRENANVIGSLFANQGLKGDALAKQTDAMIKRGADLAAVFGGPTKDAVEALSSAYKGEFDPLERYGISLKQSAISAEAMRVANVTSTKAWNGLSTAQQRAATQQATTKLITQQSARAQGQFAAQTNTLQEQQQILGAQIENIKAKIGGALIPVLSMLFVWMSSKVGPAFALVAAWVQAKLLPVLQQAGTWIATNLVPVFRQLATFVTTQVVPAIVALAQKVATNLQPIIKALAQVWQTNLLPAVRQIITAFQKWWPTISRVAAVLVQLGTWIAGKVLPVVLKFQGYLISKMVPAVIAVIGVVIKIIGKLLDFGGAVASAVGKVGEFVSGIREKFSKALDFVSGIPKKIIGALGDLGGLIKDKGVQLIAGFIAGIKSKAGEIVSTIKAYVTDKIPGFVKKALGIASPSKVMRALGKWIPAGLAKGIQDGAHGPVVATQKMLNRLQQAADRSVKKLQKKIDQAQGALDYGNSIKSAITGAFDISGAGADENGVVSLRGILGDSAKAAKDAETFAVDVGKLAARGLSKAYVDQLAAAGPAALAQAQALMGATPAQIKALNANAATIATSAKALGDQLSTQFYGIGASAAQGLIDGLSAQQNKITNAVSKVTVKKPVKKAKKDSKTHSPSRLWRQFGIDQMRGLVLGVRSQGRTVTTAAANMATALQAGFGDPQLSAVTALNGTASRAGGNTYEITVNVPVGASSAEIGRELTKHINAYERAGGRRRAA